MAKHLYLIDKDQSLLVVASHDVRSFCNDPVGTVFVLVSCSPYLPSRVLDAHLFARSLVIVEPLSIAQIDGRKLRPRLHTCSLEFPLVVH